MPFWVINYTMQNQTAFRFANVPVFCFTNIPSIMICFHSWLMRFLRHSQPGFRIANISSILTCLGTYIAASRIRFPSYRNEIGFLFADHPTDLSG